MAKNRTLKRRKSVKRQQKRKVRQSKKANRRRTKRSRGGQLETPPPSPIPVVGSPNFMQSPEGFDSPMSNNGSMHLSDLNDSMGTMHTDDLNNSNINPDSGITEEPSDITGINLNDAFNDNATNNLFDDETSMSFGDDNNMSNASDNSNASNLTDMELDGGKKKRNRRRKH